ncbi:uncharacterized protein [Gossypium hirsutum]|uniref:Uncharacterized protein isoform X2 n=1 Tax=Gossypium hirsutum TaxID=3635 RepID=A0A1U8PHJ9_GOSHI|nr:uncharacterized protein LOC107958496 isoform X2 [Gossypium hirsutum]
MVTEVLCSILASYLAMLQLTNRVSIQDLVQMEDQPFIFHFPLTPDRSRCAKIHINLQGYHEVHQLLPLFELGNNDARENQDNMKLSHENISTVQGHADFQTILTSSLAEADHKIESNPESSS